MNDSNETLKSVVSTWKLVIDGQELKDSGMMFGNGPQPIGGYGTVPSGTTFEFGKSLLLLNYFAEDRDYKVYWKSEAFRSNTVLVHGAKAHP